MEETAAQRRTHLQALIDCDVQIKRQAMSVHRDRDYTLRQITSLRTQAAKATAEADRLQDLLDNALKRYREADDRIMEARKELTIVSKAADITALEKAITQMAELSGISAAALHELVQKGVK